MSVLVRCSVSCWQVNLEATPSAALCHGYIEACKVCFSWLCSMQEVERLADEIVNDILLVQAQGGLAMAFNLIAAFA